MILASIESDFALLGGLLCMAVFSVLMIVGLALQILIRIGRSTAAQQGGASGLAKKVAAKGAVEIAKRLFWKRFG